MTSAFFATGIERTAILSPCGLYRYTLRRTWGDNNRVVNWIMLNPSKADADIDDPTITRCIGYSQAWGYDGLVVTNLFAYRSTDPTMLREAADPIGPENDEHITREASGANLVLCGWGADKAVGSRGAELLAMLRNKGIVPHCLIRTKDGFPGHPLFLPKRLKPVLF